MNTSINYLNVLPRERHRVRAFVPVIEWLPGQNKIVIDASSRTTDQLTADFAHIQPGDVVILTDVDTWMWHTMDSWIVEHDLLRDHTVYILDMGYASTRLSDRVWRLNYPYWYFRRELPTDTTFRPRSPGLKYAFGCLNNRPAPHRLWLGSELHYLRLLNKIIYTQNNYARMSETPPRSVLLGSVEGFDMDQPAYEHVAQLRGWPDFQQCLPLEWAGQPITNRHCVHHPAELETYCNITTEGMVEDLLWSESAGACVPVDLPQFSEKSWRPWAAGQVPVYLASRGHLAYIQDLGFEPMLDLLPWGFDSAALGSRIQAIVDLVGRGPEQMEEYYFTHLRELEHNHTLVFSRSVDNLIVNRIKQLINE
jgi:hypothetical protein